MDTKTPKAREKERTIAYRLSRHYSEQLEKRAAENGMSVGQYARLVLCMHFEESALHKLTDEIRDLKNEVTELRIERALQEQAA